jgi:ABC-type Na+ efflux pump permease subunit
MKKLALILVIGAVTMMSSCGPSAKEKEAKRIADSTRVADSMAMVQAKQQRIADSIAKVQAAQKRVADSIAHQDSVKKHLIKPAKKAMKPAPGKKAHKK